MGQPMTADDLRAEAERCRQSATNNGEYNSAFWVAAIILERLSLRLDSRASPDPHAGKDAKDTGHG